MTEKRFKLFVGKNYGVQKVDGEVIFDSIISMAEADVLVDLLNDLTEENEQLKTIRSDLISELDIVQNELNIAIDKGFAPTTPYKNYMASKKTEYDKFWENKIKTHNNRLNGVRE
jgi:hypothetical protein